ncbi:hypothetical protein M5K25_027687 [Dendrobium thyrsiflorum]|uniref:Uncharacterized protein n=1 Tax=Dendrobium thyrsiflorum TaxID=117978 RepID=A0ABD0TUE8_DENTH
MPPDITFGLTDAYSAGILKQDELLPAYIPLVLGPSWMFSLHLQEVANPREVSGGNNAGNPPDTTIQRITYRFPTYRQLSSVVALELISVPQHQTFSVAVKILPKIVGELSAEVLPTKRRNIRYKCRNAKSPSSVVADSWTGEPKQLSVNRSTCSVALQRKLKKSHVRRKLDFLNLQKDHEILRKDHSTLDNNHMALLDEFDSLNKKNSNLTVEHDLLKIFEHTLKFEVANYEKINEFLREKVISLEKNMSPPSLREFQNPSSNHVLYLYRKRHKNPNRVQSVLREVLCLHRGVVKKEGAVLYRRKEEWFSAKGRKSGSLPEEEGSLPSPRSGEKGSCGSLPEEGRVVLCRHQGVVKKE